MSEFISKPRKNRGNVRKRESIEEDPEADGETEIGRQAKAQKKNPMAFTTKREGGGEKVKLLYESSRQIQQADDQGATRELETETAKDRDARYATWHMPLMYFTFPLRRGQTSYVIFMFLAYRSPPGSGVHVWQASTDACLHSKPSLKYTRAGGLGIKVKIVFPVDQARLQFPNRLGPAFPTFLQISILADT